MRMVKIKHEDLTLEQVAERFLIVKEAQHTGEAAMQDYRNCLNRFIRASQNSILNSKYFENLCNILPSSVVYRAEGQNAPTIFKKDGTQQ